MGSQRVGRLEPVQVADDAGIWLVAGFFGGLYALGGLLSDALVVLAAGRLGFTGSAAANSGREKRKSDP